MEKLIHHIKRYVSLTDEQANALGKWLHVVQLKKKEHLLKEGKISNADYFVSTGCLRMYVKKDDGREQITQFAIENWWLADYHSLLTQTPSAFHIQAIENSEVIKLDTAAAEDMFRALPQMERYFRIITQKAYAAAQLRIKLLYEYSREDLYFHFVSQFPDFVQRVPQYMLASYLGFTPEYLSELRKKNYNRFS